MSELEKLSRQELLAELKHCHHEQMQYANENADLKRQIASLNNQIKNFSFDLTVCEKGIRDLESDNEKLQAQCAAMRQALEEAKKRWVSARLNIDCDVTSCGRCYGCEAQSIGYLIHSVDIALSTTAGAAKRFTAPIVCICGSTKFKQAWIAENARLTGEGNIVLAVGLWGHHERKYPAPELKVALDELHKRKIDLCDWVWVLDVGGYIGESTRSEIEYAVKLGKQVRYLSQEFPAYVEPVDDILVQLQTQTAAIEQIKRVLKEDNKKGLITDTAYQYIVVTFIDTALSTTLGADLLQRVRDLEQALSKYNDLLTKISYEIECYNDGGEASQAIAGICSVAKVSWVEFERLNLPTGHSVYDAALVKDGADK